MARIMFVCMVKFILLSCLSQYHQFGSGGFGPMATIGYPLFEQSDNNHRNGGNKNQRTPDGDDQNGVIMIMSSDSQQQSDSNGEYHSLTSDNNSNISHSQFTFNDRRRDMFFEDYSVKQIKIIDTVKVNSNNSNSDNDHKFKTNSAKKSTVIHPEEDLLSGSDSNQNNNNHHHQTIKLDHMDLIETSKNISILNVSPPAVAIDPDQLNFIVQPQRSNILLPKLEQTGRPSCLETPDDTYCENVDNYPKGLIKEDISFTADQFSEIFGSKEIDGRTIMDVENDESVCSKTPRVIYPKMAKNQANQWIYVVNEVEYTQAVVAEICQHPGKPCAYMDNLPMGMSSRCKQKYSYKRLLALHPTEKRTYPDAFRFPSCCSCYIKTVDDFMARSNFRKIDKPIIVIENNNNEQQSLPSVQKSEPEQIQIQQPSQDHLDDYSHYAQEVPNLNLPSGIHQEYHQEDELPYQQPSSSSWTNVSALALDIIPTTTLKTMTTSESEHNKVDQQTTFFPLINQSTFVVD